jgi:hypothetical protein
MLLDKDSFPIGHNNQKLIKIYGPTLININLIDKVFDFSLIMMAEMVIKYLEKLLDFNHSAVVPVDLFE